MRGWSRGTAQGLQPAAELARPSARLAAAGGLGVRPGLGPAPEGWQFFTLVRANPRAFAYGLGSSVALLVLFLAIGSAAARTLPGPELFSELLGRWVVAGLVTAFVARASTRRWGLWL